MKLSKYFVALVALFAVFAVQAQPEVVKWKTEVEHLGGDSYRVIFRAQIEPGWHLYDLGPYQGGPNATEFTFEVPAGLTLDGGVTYVNTPIRKFDEMFEMEIGYFENTGAFAQKVKLTAPSAVLKANVEWMVCNDMNCLPPTDEDFDIVIKAVEQAAASVPTTASTPAATQVADNAQSPATVNTQTPGELAAGGEAGLTSGAEDGAAAEEAAVSQTPATATPEFVADDGVASGSSIWSIIVAAMAWGLLALFTPCVFPMIPMTVSFFLKNSGNPVQGRFRALMYGFFIVALYTIPIALIILVTYFVGGEQVPADMFNWISTHWLPNIIFFLVFMVFAASFFGAFEITLPSWMVNKSDSKSEGGGLKGVFFMALTLVLVSFSCTGPIVGTAIVNSTSGAQLWEPIITMIAFSVVFAIPFTLFAFFPSLMNKMPKSGGWLNSVKVVLGFIEVALGLKFLSVADQTYHWGLLDREVYLAIWIVVFSLMGLYLLGKIKFAHDSDVKHVGVGRLTLVIATFTFVVYLVPGLWGAPLKALSGYLPPMHTQDFVLTVGGSSSNSSSNTVDGVFAPDGKAPKYSDILHLPHGLNGFFELEEAQAYASKVGKPLFIDITGHGCVNCREMEARVWSDPQVLDILSNDYVLVALYLDDKKVLPESEWVTDEKGKTLKTLGRITSYKVLQKWGVNAQPYYVLMGRDGNDLVPPRGYDLSIQGFVEFLESGKKAYKASN